MVMRVSSRPQEYRFVPFKAEVRATAEGKPPQIEGYAAVFNEPSEVLADWSGKFVEVVADGAFTKTLKDGADVRALVNHDPNFVLGRTKSNTLELWEDTKGLGFRVTPPPTQWANDLMETIRRGDVTGASFGFRTIKDRWDVFTSTEGEEIDRRWLLEAQLFDVSTATYPAYTQTEIAARAAHLGQGNRNLDEFIQQWMENRGFKLLEDAFTKLSRAVPDEPIHSDHSSSEDDEPSVEMLVAAQQRANRLRIAKSDYDFMGRLI